MGTYFKQINPLINQFSQMSSDNLEEMVMMGVISARQPWDSVGMQLDDYRQYGLRSRFVWGNKRKTLKWLLKHKKSLYHDALECLKLRGRKRSIDNNNRITK